MSVLQHGEVDELLLQITNSSDWAFIVMAGDGQMDPRIYNVDCALGCFDHVKGNHCHSSGLNNMPIVRRWASRTWCLLHCDWLSG